MAGPGHAHLLDHAKGHAAATMHRHAGRLVDGQHMLVLKKNGEFTRRRQTTNAGRSAMTGNLHGHRLGFLIGALRSSHRRQTHHIASLQPGVGLRPALVDAHLAAADDAVHMGFGHALELADQKIVQPLAAVVLCDSHQTGLGSSSWQMRLRQCGHGRYCRPDQRAGSNKRPGQRRFGLLFGPGCS